MKWIKCIGILVGRCWEKVRVSVLSNSDRDNPEYQFQISLDLDQNQVNVVHICLRECKVRVNVPWFQAASSWTPKGYSRPPVGLGSLQPWT
jgi:hypothetical protein